MNKSFKLKKIKIKKIDLFILIKSNSVLKLKKNILKEKKY